MKGLRVFLGFILVCSGMSLENTTTQSPEHKQTYVISVPKVLRCGVPATLSVTILTEHPITVTTELVHGSKSMAQIQKTIRGGSTQMLDLPPVFYDDLSFSHPYKLHVKGFVGQTQVFSNSTTMNFSPKCVSIFIQTDKNSYQPGQAVKFRVVSLTPDGKPYRGKIDIFIQDPRRNMIRQWLSVNTVLGAVSEELILSQNPSQGQWSIRADIVLPKFEVNVDVPSVHYHEDTLVGTVKARYFYGKPVSGVMNVSFDHFFYGNHLQYQQVGRIDGSADFKFEVPELGNTFVEERYYEKYRGGEYIDISVNVTEHATGLTYNNSARVSIVKSKYNLVFLQHPQFIKPAMNFSSLLKVSTYNGQPLTDEERREGIRLVTTQYKSRVWMMKDFEGAEPRLLEPQNRASAFSSDNNLTVQEMTYNVSADGIVSFHTTIADDVAMLHIEARFRDTVRQLELYTRYSSGSGSYIHLQNNSDPQVGQPLALNVESNVNLTRFHYVVMSRGRVVDAGTSQSLYFSLYPDQSWTPLACVLVYYTLSDGEIVNDALQVTFTQVLTNTKSYSSIKMAASFVMCEFQVSLRWSQDRAKPGDSVSVSVSVSESGSLVGFLVVDKATLDSKTDNGITVNTVLEEFMSYSREMINTEHTTYLYSAFELTVFQSFFLSLNLPAFIIRGELLLLEVNLFNYMDVDLEVVVVIAESPMFEFVSEGEFSLTNVRKVYVMRQNVTSILFPVRATVLGEIVFSVKATSIFTSDLVRKSVLVKPEGMEQSSTQTLFLEFPLNQRTLSRSMEFIFPADVVYGSQRASVSAVGDILGPSIGNLDSLIQLPYGCGEQNMIHFAPNVYVLQYLRSSGQNEEQTRNRAMSYMQEAYERELSYQRTDGSFSAFGDHDRSGSTWLSAFVLRCFLQARTFIPIDPTVMQRTALWLQSQQNPDGSFREPGYVIHRELQGGLDGPVSLTAYVLMALLEDDEYRIMLEASVSSAKSYLTTQLSLGITSNYSLCLVTYALSLANSPVASSALTQLLNRAIMRDGVPSWSTSGNDLSSFSQPRSSDIEMSAYVLLSMHRLARMDQGFNLMKWLSQQRNHLGGYGSTQDTVMALHALSVYASYGSSAFLNLSIAVSNLMGPVANFNINKTNYLLQQSQDLMLNVFYNINGMRTSRRRRDVYTDDFFYLYVDVADDDTFHININICFSLRPGQGLNQTGMAILDVGLLTGFSLNQDTIQTDDVVRRIETPPGRVILYLSEVNTVERCVDIPTILDFKVTNVQDAVVMIYDYYEPLRKTVRSYTSVKRRDMTVCSLCGFECAQCENQDHWPTDGTSSFNKHHLLTIIFTTLLILLSICY
ncbi:TGF-beta-1-binding protein [Triplophysa tibetana]|uniref:TGF-beta-1-binding protein n=1 Tax=Triplophysa tibetana TaxID=1572043 RepID=A0A5A9NFJ7_9TELE|nr:TGF-beta-1-binding protein [Triplophysa tibetana]